jgi:TatD DNase family protein
MASDFHTHHPNTAVRSLISSPAPIAGELTSLEFHPWHLPANFDIQNLPSADMLNKFAALGEIGLDKIRGPEIGIQQQYLHTLLALAADCRKPVVIHCVRATQELFAELKHFTGVKVMFHGFNSSAEMLDELWKRRITVSFNQAAVKKTALMNKLINAHGAYGFETDDNCDINIPLLLDEVKNTFKINDIEQKTDQYFADFLEI